MLERPPLELHQLYGSSSHTNVEEAPIDGCLRSSKIELRSTFFKMVLPASNCEPAADIMVECVVFKGESGRVNSMLSIVSIDATVVKN